MAADTNAEKSMASPTPQMASDDERDPKLMEAVRIPSVSRAITDLHRTTTAKSNPPLAAAGDAARPYSVLRWVLVLVGLYTSAFLYGLDNTIVAVTALG